MTATLLTRSITSLALAAAAFGFASCSAPTYSEVTLPPIPAGQGRVVIYRPSPYAPAVAAPVHIDGRREVALPARSFYYADQSPGTHQISIKSEWERKTFFVVKSGQTSFVECTIIPGIKAPQIIPNSVDAGAGENRAQNCKMRLR